MESGVISVVVPVYNSAMYLDKCIQSILKQSYPNWELILVDDGSSDSSPSICDDFVRQDNRVRVVHIPNGGVSNARNVGIQRATGEYIAFVDSDDYVDKDFLEELVKGMEKNNSDLCVSPLSPEHLGSSFEIRIAPDYEKELLFLFQNFLLFGPMVKLYRLEIIRNYQISFPKGISYGEDLLFNLDYLSVIDRICYINQCGYHYVLDNTESLSRKVRWNMFYNEMMLHQRLMNWLQKKHLWTESFKKNVADRVYDTSYNALMLFYRSDCTASVKESYSQIKRIVENPLLRTLLPLADSNGYAKWAVSGLEHRNAVLLTTLSMIKRRKKCLLR